MTNKNFFVTVTKISDLTENGTIGEGFDSISDALSYFIKSKTNNDSVVILWQKNGNEFDKIREYAPSTSKIVTNLFIGKINNLFK